MLKNRVHRAKSSKVSPVNTRRRDGEAGNYLLKIVEHNERSQGQIYFS